MTKANAVWPNGMPAVGDTAQRARDITARDILVIMQRIAVATPFGGIVVQGGVTSAIPNAVCYTLPITR